MIVGILKEIKKDENRVSMTPAGAEILVQAGHSVVVESTAGVNSGFTNEAYVNAGVGVMPDAEAVYNKADMVLHVKEPQPEEYGMIRPDQIIFTYLHLAADKMLTEALIKSNAVCIAYETIQSSNGSLPLLTPMSEVAGRMAAQEGAKYLEMSFGGKGKLLGGVPGVEPGTVVVLGGGVVGINAAKIACGLGARVYIADMSLDRLRYLSDVMPKNCIPVMSSPDTVRKLIADADVVIGAVLLPGAKAPKLITADMLRLMQPGTVLVDVAIDQGGCFETSRPTTHSDPVYTIDGIIHYCVANMPGAVAKTSTMALTNATLPYILNIAGKGWKGAMTEDPETAKGANIISGQVTCKGVADAFGMKYKNITELLN
ncbi:alanine dehydrogenase [Denitrovibrio acetiphilus DSM 12809]|uniref:Alanine dehydrogenase n=1 Tax=Denitrovibrio acetiphilus (strain DSM 12809 / NBRC 114555 / N2460) TaxID=522772 RepID=D4H7C1_DENA2|nr:alanine dehydrogenase [Denitrovibrio acetiphilus]ADD67920.1 alanine dehydrogenase [Denitrovibrio acetiphilus DSM 12809]